jgi:N-acetylmuramoyl-L-alanine amidase
MRRLRILALAALIAGPAVAGPRLTAVAVAPTADGQQVTLSFSEAFEAPSAFAMDAPQRLVIDLPGVTTDGRSIAGQGGVSKVRSAQFRETAARVVIDLATPMAPGGVSVDGNALVIQLRDGDAAMFARYLKRGRQALPGGATPTTVAAVALPVATPKIAVAETPKPSAPKPEPVKVIAAAPSPTPVRAEPKFVVAPPVEVAAVAPRRVVKPVRDGYRPVVVIDAGHGGHDVGAPSVLTGRYEKEVTLAVAKAIRRELEDSGQFKVVLTRDDDRFIPLPDRVRIARAAKASLFISVHADSAPSAEARGATVYTLSEVASDREAARLAAKENRAGMIGGYNVAAESADVASVLFDLTQRETMNTSADFATKLQREMGDEVHFRSNAHRFAGFVVLKAADTPSVLLETGYMSNEEDSKFLFSESGQRLIARGVRQAVEAHFKPRIASR